MLTPPPLTFIIHNKNTVRAVICGFFCLFLFGYSSLFFSCPSALAAEASKPRVARQEFETLPMIPYRADQACTPALAPKMRLDPRDGTIAYCNGNNWSTLFVPADRCAPLSPAAGR